MNVYGPDPVRCPHCQAVIDRPDAPCCWLCGQEFGPTASPAEAPRHRSKLPSPHSETFGRAASPAEAPPQTMAARRTFGMSSVMLVIALIAVCLGVIREAPVPGILLASAVTPALVWTVSMASRSKAEEGRSLPALEKVGVFFFALAAVVIIGISTLVAFVITCFPIGLASYSANTFSPVFAFGLGIIAAIAAGYGTFRLTRRLWKRKDRR